MKKRLFLLFVAAIMGMTAMAQRQTRPYNYGIGAVVGFMNGITFKAIPIDNFAIQADFGYRFLYMHNVPYMITVNPNFMYEKAASNGFYWFIGGGINLGGAPKRHYYNHYPEGFTVVSSFVSGINVIGGAEYQFPKIPLSLQVDARPGLFLLSNKYGTSTYFDYSFLNFSAKYVF